MKWPVSKANTILNIVPQGEVMVVERLGKFHSIQPSGWFFAVPVIDRIAYIVDMREKSILINPQSCISKDNVSLAVSGNVYTRFVDGYNAAYGSFNPIYNVVQNAQSAMRAAIGSMEFDDILQERQAINDKVLNALQKAADPWGVEVLRYEITEVQPDRAIVKAMDKQAIAERDRREQVLAAEGLKRSFVLESEGIKLRKQNESEGELIKIRNEAQAEKEKLTLEAEGKAQAILVQAQAQAEAIRRVAEALNSPGGQSAAQLDLAAKYVKMYGELSGKSNTMLIQEKPADINSLVSQAAAVFNHAQAATSQK
eukprot:CAMPEP_0175100336 /NCGR_PEP_ID=MMETSP0086_2-20121207/7041_1 /TAXON_ID=136419 /ORGANISM="Unknown Unknown, Strain D1" /LENGTH=311 /DNA_ID=CAMNT_0016374457 /DNA_START=154 /DNA_END=1089 /DNA_ORIENTATION=+